MRFLSILFLSIISHALVLNTERLEGNDVDKIRTNASSKAIYINLLKEIDSSKRHHLDNNQIVKNIAKVKKNKKIFPPKNKPIKNDTLVKKNKSNFWSLQNTSNLNLLINPNYPEIAKRLGLEGSVEYDIHVDADGKPVRVKLIKSSGHEVLDDNAKRTILNSKFSNKKGSEVILTLTVKYIL